MEKRKAVTPAGKATAEVLPAGNQDGDITPVAYPNKYILLQ
ncbi:putative oligopeptide transporter (OPT) family protein [Evansella vedderi]|uniref:Oligopeptide transporter (OPT) family protein n=1 Tax=Evansella vedderi TaxID=38282 RepID=A0ABT9ZRR5_9BACI|nr:putative oligopeptide transporter (OPT) family protein [Evansella vedderi]